jgi:hypothetical protein
LGKRQIDKAIDAPWKYTVEVQFYTENVRLRQINFVASGLDHDTERPA